MTENPELIVLTKTYDLILWSWNYTSKFPRNHRFVLGERIERNLYDLLETLIQAKYTKQRQPLLERANLMLEILRFQMRLANGKCAITTTAQSRPVCIDLLTCPNERTKSLSHTRSSTQQRLSNVTRGPVRLRGSS